MTGHVGGSLISALADEIFFAPRGIIGAAAVIRWNRRGSPCDTQVKIDTLHGRQGACPDSRRSSRADVLRAMMQEDYVLELDGETLKEEGKLLRPHRRPGDAANGEPPTPLFGAGIYDDVE
jgi:membrane-bound serine protease (ClpP class)